jgi:hypothetical protein
MAVIEVQGARVSSRCARPGPRRHGEARHSALDRRRRRLVVAPQRGRSVGRSGFEGGSRGSRSSARGCGPTLIARTAIVPGPASARPHQLAPREVRLGGSLGALRSRRTTRERSRSASRSAVGAGRDREMVILPRAPPNGPSIASWRCARCDFPHGSVAALAASARRRARRLPRPFAISRSAPTVRPIRVLPTCGFRLARPVGASGSGRSA